MAKQSQIFYKRMYLCVYTAVNYYVNETGSLKFYDNVSRFTPSARYRYMTISYRLMEDQSRQHSLENWECHQVMHRMESDSTVLGRSSGWHHSLICLVLSTRCLCCLNLSSKQPDHCYMKHY